MAIRIAGSTLPPQAPASVTTTNRQATPPASGDRHQRTPAPVEVMTFNTAGDGCKHTPEDQIPLSAPFQKVVQGAPDAPIIAMQEMTKPLTTSLAKLSKNGNFQLVSQGPNWLPSFMRESMFLPDNAVVVPKRYQIQSTHWIDFGGRLGLFFGAIKNFLFHGGSFQAIADSLLLWGCCELRLKDKQTGKSFTVIATHLCGRDTVRRVLEPQLKSVVRHAESQGPVVVMGDFNTPSEATNVQHDPTVTRFWNALKPLGLVDNGASDKTSGKRCIDHVLTSGFQAVGDEVYNGNKLTIPGRPNAREVSDHYAHGASLAFAASPAPSS